MNCFLRALTSRREIHITAAGAIGLMALWPSASDRIQADDEYFDRSYSFSLLAAAKADGLVAANVQALQLIPMEEWTMDDVLAMVMTNAGGSAVVVQPAPPLTPGQTHLISSHVHSGATSLHYSWSANHNGSSRTHGANTDFHVNPSRTDGDRDLGPSERFVHSPDSSFHWAGTSNAPYPNPPFHNPVSWTHAASTSIHKTSSVTHSTNSSNHSSNSNTHAVGSSVHKANSRNTGTTPVTPVTPVAPAAELAPAENAAQ